MELPLSIRTIIVILHFTLLYYMKNLVILSAVLCMMAASTSLYAQKAKGGTSGSSDVRIAVVDVEKVAKELPEAIDADKKLTEMRNKLVDTLKTMEKRFKEKYEAYTKNKSMMTADAQKKEEDELTNMNQQYSVYQEENFGAQGALAKKRAELLKPVLDKIQESVQMVAKEERLSAVFDKMQSGIVIYADDKIDITFKVIDRMKQMR